MPKQKADREQYRIRIGEAIVPVNREIYHTYYGGERQERYQVERDQAHGTLHFSAMGEEGVDVLEILPVRGETPLDTMERRERDAFLSAALYRLPGPDRKLIRQLTGPEADSAALLGRAAPDRNRPAGGSERGRDPQAGTAYPQIAAHGSAGGTFDSGTHTRQKKKMQVIPAVCRNPTPKAVHWDCFSLFEKKFSKPGTNPLCFSDRR